MRVVLLRRGRSGVFFLTPHPLRPSATLCLVRSNEAEIGHLEQTIVQRISETSAIVLWNLHQNEKASFELLLFIEEERETVNGKEIIRISVVSTDRVKLDIDADLKQYKVASSKTIKLDVKKGEIILYPEKFGQTCMTMRVDVSFVEQKVVTSNSSKVNGAKMLMSIVSNRFSRKQSRRRSTRRDTIKMDASGKMEAMSNIRRTMSNAGDAFSLIGVALYDRFEKEDIIDNRMWKQFVRSLASAPPLTEDEKKLFARMDTVSQEMCSAAKRLPGTVDDTCEVSACESRNDELRSWQVIEQHRQIVREVLRCQL